MTDVLLVIHLTYIISMLIGILTAMHVVQQGRTPQAMVAWLLFIIFVPIIGVVVYFMFGIRKSSKSFEHLKQDISLTELETVPESEAHQVDMLLRNYGLSGATRGNNLRLCWTGEDGYRELCELIDSSEHFIHIETFVFFADEVGSDIINRLAKKAEEGVEVRLLVDALGTLPSTRRTFRKLSRAGGHVSMFMPLIHYHGSTNLRNHRKIVISDGTKVMAGGTNIATDYIGPVPTATRWKDLSFIVEGPACCHYADIFRSDWHFASGEELDTSYSPRQSATEGGSDTLQIVPSGPDFTRDILYNSILDIIYQARDSIWIITPYFIPNDSLSTALRVASFRGVDVRVLTPSKSNHGLANLARGPYLRDLQDAGVQVKLYKPGMVHAKVMTVDDDFAMIGSTNMDLRSLFLNYEVSMYTYSPSLVEQTRKWYTHLEVDCETGVGKVGHGREFLEGMSQIIAPIL
ncbi:MAG: cardiolipin synthase [Phycisphaerae bacterium]|nr:cardiolipin synthase [Phycisphaerae bacterium]